jgi:polyisoprenoid-binding protein YceI
MKRFFAVSITSLAIAWAPACDKKDPAADKPAETDKAAADKAAAEKAAAEKAAADKAAAEKAAAEAKAAEEAKAAAEKAAAEAAAKAAADAAGAEAKKDFIHAIINHHDTSKGLVTVEFPTYEIKKANVNFEKLEEAMAVIEVDLGVLKSGVDKRDEHLKSADFFDVAQFAKATVTVSKVEKTEEADVYKAVAEVDIHGVKKEVPVTFKVVEKKEDGTHVVEAETKGLLRDDWKVGGAPEAVNAAPSFDLALRLSVKTVLEGQPAADGAAPAPAADGAAPAPAPAGGEQPAPAGK